MSVNELACGGTIVLSLILHSTPIYKGLIVLCYIGILSSHDFTGIFVYDYSCINRKAGFVHLIIFLHLSINCVLCLCVQPLVSGAALGLEGQVCYAAKSHAFFSS